MGARILIVEDEALVAADLADSLEDMGHQPIGIAADSETAFDLAEQGFDLALVDVNLRDGVTGPKIARHIALQTDAEVIFVTANPEQLEDGVPGAIGVIAKPVPIGEVEKAVDYALACRRPDKFDPPPPPTSLRLF